jgi:hypothetical protein
MRRKPLFPPPESRATGKRKRHKGKQRYSILTVNGRIRLCRIRWHCPEDGTSTLTDRWLDEAESTVSQGARELICRLNQSSASFRKTSENLKRAAQIDSNPETVRQLVEGEGKAALRALDQGTLDSCWTASDCRVETGKTRVYVSCDGVKVATITDAEKKTRRQKARENRRRRGRKCKPLSRAKPGSDNAWKEFRLVAHYDETQSHCHVSVTRGNHEAAGRLMARDAKTVRLHEADERIANVDGAPWIRSQLEFHGTVDHIGLDFYHLSEYVHAARRDLFGEQNADGSAWADRMMHTLKHDGYWPAWQMASDCRAAAVGKGRQSVDRLLSYMAERREMICYPEFLARGWQIGSGPIEAQCKTTTARVKGSGKRWDAANAEAVMALACLENSRLWQDYWLTADPAAS